MMPGTNVRTRLSSVFLWSLFTIGFEFPPHNCAHVDETMFICRPRSSDGNQDMMQIDETDSRNGAYSIFCVEKNLNTLLPSALLLNLKYSLLRKWQMPIVLPVFTVFSILEAGKMVPN